MEGFGFNLPSQCSLSDTYNDAETLAGTPFELEELIRIHCLVSAVQWRSRKPPGPSNKEIDVSGPRPEWWREPCVDRLWVPGHSSSHVVML